MMTYMCSALVGLFHAVIEESGCDTAFWAVNWPAQQPWNYTKQVAVKVGCPTEPSDVMVECLRTIDARELEDNSSISCTVKLLNKFFMRLSLYQTQ